jgi:hypothetical protein
MASASFRDSMGSLGWSRREPEPVNTSSPSILGRLQNLNPFGEGGYVRLPITETNPGAPLPAPTRREEEEGWFARKYTSRYCGKALTHLFARPGPIAQPLPRSLPIGNFSCLPIS